jgi:hypothetical protein
VKIISALLIKNIGYCLPVCSCFVLRIFFIKIEAIIAIRKVHKTKLKPSLKIGDGEKKPLLVKKKPSNISIACFILGRCKRIL